MSEEIKNTAITAAGYVYQNRQGLRLLCDWLDAPTLYTRVKFECDDEADAPKGLDDIVAERTGGLVDLEQVKYTPNPAVYALSWEWMLEKSGSTAKSRSMLRKWFDAFAVLDPARVGVISLKTNRRPDAEIEACLSGGRIDFAKVPEPRRSALLAELGDEMKCEAFFSQLQVLHSDKGFESLEREVDARLHRHGTPEGIANLKNVALNWAIRKNFPPPDGWISLDQVRTILRAAPPAPLPEDFFVPLGYEVPDETFHRDFVRDTAAGAGQAFVLTGPPGRGKSTYLSALCDKLASLDIPTVRHHYFLSTTERGRDRVHSYMVEQSIAAQVKQFHPGVQTPGGNLRGLLEACAAYYQEKGKPFVLVLDGLDHVWRINAADKRPLDDLFSQVLPCPDNMVLLVGTQPVDDAQLPKDLLAVAPKASWRELPAMSENAVLSYLRKAVDEGRLSTRFDHEEQSERQLQEAATALRKKTNGHGLRQQGIEQRLWIALLQTEHDPVAGQAGNEVLGVTELGLNRPEPVDAQRGRRRCFQPARHRRHHLLDALVVSRSRAHKDGQALVEDLQACDRRMQQVLHLRDIGLSNAELRRNIQERSPRPEEGKRAHQAQRVLQTGRQLFPQGRVVELHLLGHVPLQPPDIPAVQVSPGVLKLRGGIDDVQWVVAALDTNAFADAYRLDHLKARMVRGSEFQMQDDDMARLVSFTLMLTADDGVVREAVASRHETDILRVAALGLALQARGQPVLAKTCGAEALRRFRGLSRFSTRYSSNAGTADFKFLVEAFARLGVLGATSEAFAKLVRENGPIVWMPRARMLVDEGVLDDLMDATTPLPPDDPHKSVLSDVCARAAATAGVSVFDHDDFSKLARTPFVAALEAARSRVSKPLNEPIPIEWLKGDYYERKDDLSALVHHWFFSGVHLSLCMQAEGQTGFEFVRAPTYEDRRNISYFLNSLSAIAAQVAERWWRGEFVDFNQLFELLKPVQFRRFRQGYDASSAAEDFRAGLHRIACDIRLGSCLLAGRDDVDVTEATMVAAGTSEWFDPTSFRTQYEAGLLTRMSDEAAAAFIQSQRVLLDAEIRQETSIHLQMPLQLCGIALSHGLNTSARELCTQTWELVTGYGHRKDPTLNNTVDAIDYLVEVVPDDARRLLSLISPQVHRVLDFTDGKGTRHVLSAADRLLAKLCPPALVVKYEEHTDAGDWSHAEDSLRAYVEQGVRDSWPLDALMRTGVHPEVQDALMQLERNGQDGAAERLRFLREHAGWDVGVLQRKDLSSGDIDSKPYIGDVTTFAPEQVDELLASLSTSYNEKKRLLRAWYEHWDTRTLLFRATLGTSRAPWATGSAVKSHLGLPCG